ncbi:MAG: PAS domain S-box protein [Acetobacteraceae bacterium]
MDPPGPSNENGGASAAADFQTFPLARDEILTLAERSAGIGVWDIDLTTDMLRGTPQFFRIMGLEPTGRPIPTGTTRQLRHPQDRQRVTDAFRQAIDGGTDYCEVEYRIIRHDGQTRWILGRGRVIRDAAGRAMRYSGVDVDVTESKRSQAALRESEARFRRVFEQSPLGKVTADAAFHLREVNPALCRMLGYDADELIGRGLLDFVHPDDRAGTAAGRQRLMTGAVPQIQLELRFIRKSGEPLWVSVNVGPIRDLDGRFLYSLGVIEDIDERKRITQALQDSERRLRQLNEQLEQQAEERARQLASSRAQLQAFFDNSPDWLTLVHALPDGSFVFADLNPTSEAAYGLPRDQVVGRKVEDILGAEPARVPLHYLRECLRTGEPQRYVVRRTMAGRTRTIDVMFVLVPQQAPGDDRYVITTARDITEREQLEAQLRQAQKMEAIGQLTGGVAHDFNNLLAVISGNAELAKRRPNANLTKLMDNIVRAGERGTALTRQLLSLSRRHSANPQVLNLRQEMARITEMLRASLRGDIRLDLSVAEDVWPIEVDLAELEIALLNVAANARDAMPQGGEFSIEVRNAPHHSAPLADVDHVVIAMRDTGTGIPAEVVAKVFDPFFTTKELGQGTGLGLSQVYGFARQSGGTAAVDSQPGRGTTLSLYLPRCRKEMTAADAPDRAASTQPESGRILLVEDNPEVAAVTAQMLTAMGFTVESADRARKALALLDANRTFDLLLTDVVMPEGMTGLDLAKTVRSRLPNLPILLISGYNDVVARNGAEFPVLRKPVPYEELRRIICLCLDRAAKARDAVAGNAAGSAKDTASRLLA